MTGLGPDDVGVEHKVDLVREFIQRAKEVEVLIDVMPQVQDSESIVRPPSPLFPPGSPI